MNKLVEQNLKRIATELLGRFDYSEVDDLLLDIEEIEKALTPISNDEVKEVFKQIHKSTEFATESTTDEDLEIYALNIIADELYDKLTQYISQLESKVSIPTADEIVKELNEEYGVDDFKLVWNGTHTILSFYSTKAPCDINCNVLSENKNLSVGADWYEEPYPLTLAHKITSFFMSLEEK